MLYWVPQLLYQIISTLILAVPTDELGPAIGCWFSCRARFPCVYQYQLGCHSFRFFLVTAPVAAAADTGAVVAIIETVI